MAGNGFRRPQTAQEAVLAELRRAIARGEMAPGSAIPQTAAAAQMGVSRVPVREALKILEGEGHVHYEPHRGYTVTELDANELLEIYRIRGLLERHAVATAAPNLTSDDIATMNRLIGEMDVAAANEDIGALSDANRRFHFLLYEASGQAHLVRLIRQLWDASDPYRTVYFGSGSNRQHLQNEHRAIVEAADARDTERLQGLLDVHRDHASLVIASALGSSG